MDIEEDGKLKRLIIRRRPTLFSSNCDFIGADAPKAALHKSLLCGWSQRRASETQWILACVPDSFSSPTPHTDALALNNQKRQTKKRYVSESHRFRIADAFESITIISIPFLPIPLLTLESPSRTKSPTQTASTRCYDNHHNETSGACL